MIIYFILINANLSFYTVLLTRIFKFEGGELIWKKKTLIVKISVSYGVASAVVWSVHAHNTCVLLRIIIFRTIENVSQRTHTIMSISMRAYPWSQKWNDINPTLWFPTHSQPKGVNWTLRKMLAVSFYVTRRARISETKQWLLTTDRKYVWTWHLTPIDFATAHTLYRIHQGRKNSSTPTS